MSLALCWFTWDETSEVCSCRARGHHRPARVGGLCPFLTTHDTFGNPRLNMQTQPVLPRVQAVLRGAAWGNAVAASAQLRKRRRGLILARGVLQVWDYDCNSSLSPAGPCHGARHRKGSFAFFEQFWFVEEALHQNFPCCNTFLLMHQGSYGEYFSGCLGSPSGWLRKGPRCSNGDAHPRCWELLLELSQLCWVHLRELKLNSTDNPLPPHTH